MRELLDILPGAKTYIVIGAAASVWAAGALGLLTPEVTDQWLKVCAVAAGGTLAMKIDRIRNSGTTQLMLLGLVTASMLTVGCAFVRYDGDGARAIAEGQLQRVVEEGSPVSTADCEPVQAFADQMRDGDGPNRITRWLWDDESDSEPRQIAAIADQQYRGCSILERRGASGQTADGLRAVLQEFWTGTGLAVGSGSPLPE